MCQLFTNSQNFQRQYINVSFYVNFNHNSIFFASLFGFNARLKRETVREEGMDYRRKADQANMGKPIWEECFLFTQLLPNWGKKQLFKGKDFLFSEPKKVFGFMQTYLSYGLFLFTIPQFQNISFSTKSTKKDFLTCKYSQGSFLKKINDLKKQGVLSTVSPPKI